MNESLSKIIKSICDDLPYEHQEDTASVLEMLTPKQAASLAQAHGCLALEPQPGVPSPESLIVVAQSIQGPFNVASRPVIIKVMAFGVEDEKPVQLEAMVEDLGKGLVQEAGSDRRKFEVTVTVLQSAIC